MNEPYPEDDYYYEPNAFGMWMRRPGIREVFESIILAVMVSMMFRFFETEAYIIPTGSMAPDLQGRHVDVVCPMCDFSYRAGDNASRPSPITKCVCPICQFVQPLNRSQSKHQTFAGDRILVNKYAYDFAEPQRWDVIVFKYPNNGKQNFIKRLIGLPNEAILVERGDIYTYAPAQEDFANRKIARKPPDKLAAMLHVVDDTNHIPDVLVDLEWPSRWQAWNQTDSKWQVGDFLSQFELTASDETSWLRYRHLQPQKNDWETFINPDGRLPPHLSQRIEGQLITDYLTYNDTPMLVRNSSAPDALEVEVFQESTGVHWVGDLAVSAEIETKSDQGMLALEVVEGGVRFRCSIDVATGEGYFTSFSRLEEAGIQLGESKFQAPTMSPGKYKLKFANADDQLYFWIDDQFIAKCPYQRTSKVLPFWESSEFPGDAEPVGIAGKNISMTVNRLQVLRDVYYTSKNQTVEQNTNSNGAIEYIQYGSLRKVRAVLRDPRLWASQYGQSLFQSQDRNQAWAFHLGENQYFPMGDNSPISDDARTWEGARYIDRSYLLGKAMFVYWPHPKTSPLPIWPNFERMRFIR